MLEEHDKRLQRILQRCKEVNLQFNKEKCKFRVNEVSYVGHLLTDNGVIPDPDKIKAIQKMPPPETKPNRTATNIRNDKLPVKIHS